LPNKYNLLSYKLNNKIYITIVKINIFRNFLFNLITYMTTFRFKKNHDFYKRLNESDRIMRKYPSKLPVIVEKHESYADIPDIDRSKYLVPNDITMAEFMYVIRKRIHITPDKSIYLFVDNLGMVPTSYTAIQVYEQAQDKDGFLYIKYCGESTFG